MEIGRFLVSPYSSLENLRISFGIWQCYLRGDIAESKIEGAIDRANLFLLSKGTIDGRVFSASKHVNVYKEVGYPLEVAKMNGLDVEREELIYGSRTPANPQTLQVPSQSGHTPLPRESAQ